MNFFPNPQNPNPLCKRDSCPARPRVLPCPKSHRRGSRCSWAPRWRGCYPERRTRSAERGSASCCSRTGCAAVSCQKGEKTHRLGTRPPGLPLWLAECFLYFSSSRSVVRLERGWVESLLLFGVTLPCNHCSAAWQRYGERSPRLSLPPRLHGLDHVLTRGSRAAFVAQFVCELGIFHHLIICSKRVFTLLEQPHKAPQRALAVILLSTFIASVVE